MNAIAAFDPVGGDQLDDTLRAASAEDHGRALAVKCKQALAAAESARTVALTSRDLVAVASAAETAHMAAAWCGRFATAVGALLGAGDVALVKECYAHQRKAMGHAAVAESRWETERRRRAGVA